MKVILNGKMIETSVRNLEQLIVEMDFSGQKIATALNGQFVPTSARKEARIAEGDKIEIVSPRQGG